MSIPPMPLRIAALPQDERGYPIPWNVLRDDKDRPLFTVNDTAKHMLALENELCPICGGRLGKWKWFVGGPKSAFAPDGWYFDLPGHEDCIQFALQTCPWLALPNYHQHKVALLDRVKHKAPEGVRLVDHTQDPVRPLLFVMAASAKINVHVQATESTGDRLPYVQPRKPLLGVQYWQHGKRLTVAEGEALVRQALA